MEMTKVPEAGFEIMGLNISGLQRRLTLENLLFPLKVFSSFLASLKIIKKFKPDVVVGFGGYASSPITLAAGRMKVPILLQEQNSYAGLANKTISKRASVICVAYDGLDRYFDASKIVITGNPVRDVILNSTSTRDDALSTFNLSSQQKTLLILGGSLGARTINESIIQNIDELRSAGINVLWQTGSLYYQEMIDRLAENANENVRLVEFIREMDKAYAVADLVVSRAGALTISELCLVGKPVVFVPSPNVAEDHQTKNAMALVRKDAAEIVSDRDAVSQLVGKTLELINSTDRLATLSANIKALAKPKATEDIANQVIGLIK